MDDIDSEAFHWNQAAKEKESVKNAMVFMDYQTNFDKNVTF